ncbi:iqgap- protein [Tieghemiomyces parasiticus]|uniref:Iqgap- protein n=1 Tax=Tieghemiomyces parasiticus TaxID=78921 RepID=A0A9W8A705_9FUNG|nr:iqgap- protein [Tieghemiomyces parasiticus]
MLQALDTLSLASSSPSRQGELGLPPDSPDVAGLRGRYRLQRHVSQEGSPRYIRNGNWCDLERRKLQAYEYLCHIGEAKEWIEACIKEEIPPAERLEEALRDGVVLAKLARTFDPDAVPRIFTAPKLQYRHSDNTVCALNAIRNVGLPKLFHFEVVDLYDRKNFPKVIYCIHALSHFLARQNLAPHIKNLFGYLQFTDEQLAITGQELANGGYSMPAFKNITTAMAEPTPAEEGAANPDDVFQSPPAATQLAPPREILADETPEGRAQLYWEKQIDIVIQFQAFARGELARREAVARKQAHSYMRLVDRVTQIQALIRGYLARRRLYEMKLLKQYLPHLPQIVLTQAHVRRLLARRLADRLRMAQYEAALAARANQAYVAQVTRAQAAVRGFLTRRALARKRDQERYLYHVVRLQAQVRGQRDRRRTAVLRTEHDDRVRSAVLIQAHARGMLERRRYQEMRRRFHRFLEGLVGAQALIRGHLARARLPAVAASRVAERAAIVKCQAAIRGFLARQIYRRLLHEQGAYERNVVRLQARARGVLARRHFQTLLTQVEADVPQVVRAQAAARGWLARRQYKKRLVTHRRRAEAAVKIQNCVRQFLGRRAAERRLEHFEQHMATIVRIQSLYRAKLAGKAYRTLTTEQNPPVATMRSFVYLLDDSDQDFEEELELERLRQQAVRRIRDNHATEHILNDLDIKIALLVKNRITLEELIKTSRYKFLDDQRYLAAAGGVLGASFNASGLTHHSVLSPFVNGSATGTWNSLYHLDKDSRRRLESYQHLFYLLQTQPLYLARLLFALNKSPLGEKNKKFMETVVLSLFGFAQNAREEYLLLQLFKTAIDQEMDSIGGIHEFLRGNPVFIKLAVHHNRGAKERKYLRELLQPLVLQVIDNPTLDLESDPLVIYRGLIREEESRTGMRSLRPYDISREEALNDMETRTTLIKHLQQLRTITDQFIEAILASLDSMPYGIRYIARELQRALVAKFPQERENTVMKVVGHLVYYRYINPAIVAPDSFDVVESVINPLQRKNLAEIAKMLNQVSVGKLFSDDNMFLKPLNNYVAYTSERFAQYSYAVTNVMDPDIYFQIDEFSDMTQTHKPIIYLSPQEVFAMHQALEDNLEVLAPGGAEDPLRIILHDLGPAPAVRSEFKTNGTTMAGAVAAAAASSAAQTGGAGGGPGGSGNEISLSLTDRFAHSNIKDHESVIKHLFVETKRYILYIIRVQSGRSLLDILEKSVTQRDELRFREIIKREEARKHQQPSMMASAIGGGPSHAGGITAHGRLTPGGPGPRPMSVVGGSAAPSPRPVSGLYGPSLHPAASFHGDMTPGSMAGPGMPRARAGSSPAPHGHHNSMMGTSTLSSGSSSASGPAASKSLLDLSALTFNSLKKMTLLHMAKLESEGQVSKSNEYQAMLNSIATDIRNKHRRRVQRTQELRKIRQTLVNLAEKSGYLDEQKRTYLDYIHSCIQQLSHSSSAKDRRHRTVLPFTRQYFHLKDLQRTGKVPQFGSYKYTAERLYQKGVIVAIDGYNPRQFDKITLVISSDVPGLFGIEVSLLGIKMPGGEMEIRLEDLLQYQFNNTPVISIFDGAVRVNVNLLVFLINRKFYR